MPRATIQIVTHNSIQDLCACLDSLSRQEFKDFEIIIVDNGSSDATKDFLKNWKAGRVVLNDVNLGFAMAHNQAFNMSNSEFAVVMNPDVILTPACIFCLIKTIEAQNTIGAIQGRMLLLDVEGERTNIIDSVGMRHRWWGQVQDIGQGEKDWGQFNEPRQMFGVTGAFAMYRRRAIMSVKDDEDVFDSDLFMYKEDVDLAFRLNKKGWKAFYEPRAIAYHKRGAGKNVARQARSVLVRELSFANGVLVALKNESRARLPVVSIYFLLYFIFLLFKDRDVLPASVKRIKRFYSQMVNKRHEAVNHNSELF